MCPPSLNNVPRMAPDEVAASKVSLSLHDMIDGSQAVSGAASEGGQKKTFQPYHSKSVPKPEKLGDQAEEDGRLATTMMLRNIPNKYTQSTLMQEIDSLSFAGTYDFFYLPMDVHNRSNVGYAFINFLAPADAESFFKMFKEHRFKKYQSRKISSVCPAHVQGLDANLRHFENRAVIHARNDQYRPVVLRQGERVDFEVAVAEAKAKFAGDAPEPPRRSAAARDAAARKPNGAAAAQKPVVPARQNLQTTLCEYYLTRQISDASTATAGGEYGDGRSPYRCYAEFADVSCLRGTSPAFAGSFSEAAQARSRTLSDASDGHKSRALSEESSGATSPGDSIPPPPGLGVVLGQAADPASGIDAMAFAALHAQALAGLADEVYGYAALHGMPDDRLLGFSGQGSMHASSLMASASGPAYIPLPKIPSSSLIFQGCVTDEFFPSDGYDGVAGCEMGFPYPYGCNGYSVGAPCFEL